MPTTIRHLNYVAGGSLEQDEVRRISVFSLPQESSLLYESNFASGPCREPRIDKSPQRSGQRYPRETDDHQVQIHNEDYVASADPLSRGDAACPNATARAVSRWWSRVLPFHCEVAAQSKCPYGHRVDITPAQWTFQKNPYIRG